MNRFFLYLTLFSFVFGQGLEWPTSASRSFSSNFGENRGDHFHMGIDIKTNETTGYPVFAVDDGYISRIVSNFSGFGKALYLKTNSGETALYAHLKSFSPLLEKVWDLNKIKNKSYFVNSYFSKSEFPVKKGDIIGYSGNTGNSFGPHLHFEYRNSSDEPLNPLSSGFSLPDRVTPILKEIALTPLSQEASINASSITQSFPLFRDRNGIYLFPDTLSVFGEVGISIKMIDKREGASNRYQIYKAELWVDNQLAFSVQYDKIPYNQTARAITLLQPTLYRQNMGDYQNLYRISGQDKLSIHRSDNSGVMRLSPGLHSIEIRVWDVAGNQAVAKGMVAMAFPSKVKVEPIFRNEKVITFAISPKSGAFPIKEATLYSFTLYGYADQKLELVHQERVGKELHVTVAIENIKNRIIQFICKNTANSMATPVHWQEGVPLADMISLHPDLKISHTDFGVLLQIETGRFTEASVQLKLANDNTFKVYPVKQIQPNVYLSEVIPPKNFLDVKFIDVSFQKNGQTRDVRFASQFGVAEPNHTTRILSQDKNCAIITNKNTVYRSVAFWIERVKKSAPIQGGFQLSPVYQLQPYEIAFKDSFKVAIRYDKKYALHSKMAIYQYNQKEEEWTFLPTKNDRNKRVLSTSLRQCNAITVIQDLSSPVIGSSFPAKGGHYQAEDLDIIRIQIKDAISGIDGNEKTLSLKVNDKSVLFAYQPVKKEISYILPTLLTIGAHNITISATDRVGNTMTKTIPFLVVD